jgi:hypothetical protein
MAAFLSWDCFPSSQSRKRRLQIDIVCGHASRLFAEEAASRVSEKQLAFHDSHPSPKKGDSPGSFTVVPAGREQFVEVSVKSLGWPAGTTNALCWLPLYLPRVRKAGMPRREKQETAKRANSSDKDSLLHVVLTTRQAVDVAWPVEMVGAHGACASRLRGRSWPYVDEAGDGLEAAVLAHDAEVGADEVGRRILRPARFPREADAVVVSVDHAGQAETIGWETLLDGLDHRIDGLVTVPAPMRIDIVPFLGPRVGDQDPTATRILLVPGG